MRLFFLRFFLLVFHLTLFISAFPNRPQIVNIYRERYHADNKNWSVGQDERGIMYFGNDIGLLEFDGIEWNLNRIPNSLTARSIAVLSHKTVFTGSYEEFGRWDRNISGKLVYKSLSEGLDKSLFKNDDFWKIWIGQGCVYFQSFSSIYIYDYKTVQKVSGEDGFLFLCKVRDEFLVQKMLGALYKLEGTQLTKIEGSDIFRNTDVRVILPYLKDQYIIGTSTKGMYIYDGKVFREWNPSLSTLINSKELNCGIISSKGTYYLGTILDGIYEVDINGNILDHISSDNTLQNNTILALYEDNMNNVWAALDRGISYIRYINNMSCYTDPRGSTGAVYAGIYYDDKLFVGTNQGVFYIHKGDLDKPNVLANMKLINGTQGQVWAFKIIDGVLYCCHNKGLKAISSNLVVTDAYSVGTGVYNISETRINNKDVLLLSTYNSIKLIDKKTKTLYAPQQISEPIINAQVDHLGNLWLEHFNRGVYRCKLDDDLLRIRSFSYYGGNNKDGLPYKLKLFKVGGRVVLLGDNRFYTYNDVDDHIVSNSTLDECFKNTKNIKQVIPLADNMFWALTNSSVYKFSYDGYDASILENYNLGMDLSLVNAYENASVLDTASSLICLDNGFLLYNASNGRKEQADMPNTLIQPYLESLETLSVDGQFNYEDLTKSARISNNFNTIRFYFTSNDSFTSNLYFQYMLEGVDLNWSSPQKINSVSYARLPKGEYTFMVRTVDNLGNYSEALLYKFEVLPPWYQTTWAYLLYVFVVAGLMYIVWMLILRRYRNIHLKKIRLRETRRLRALAGELQQEVEQKNAELLTQTSFIIQKNELILRVKDIVDDFYSKNKTSSLAPLYQKINSLLNNNMNTEDDWKMFLIKFEEKHTGFFKRLKILYPQLTNSDLRLCACLKLNLETKEIASLMNLSVRAVENSRYRLRKKLNIQPSQNLNEFFVGID